MPHHCPPNQVQNPKHGQRDLPLAGFSLPFSAHLNFNSLETCPAWSPHQIEEERRASWVPGTGTAQSYERVYTFREVGMGQKGQGLMSSGSLCPNSMRCTLYSRPLGAFVCVIPSLWSAKFQILIFPSPYLGLQIFSTQLRAGM